MGSDVNPFGVFHCCWPTLHLPLWLMAASPSQFFLLWTSIYPYYCWPFEPPPLSDILVLCRDGWSPFQGFGLSLYPPRPWHQSRLKRTPLWWLLQQKHHIWGHACHSPETKVGRDTASKELWGCQCHRLLELIQWHCSWLTLLLNSNGAYVIAAISRSSPNQAHWHDVPIIHIGEWLWQQ